MSNSIVVANNRMEAVFFTTDWELEGCIYINVKSNLNGIRNTIFYILPTVVFPRHLGYSMLAHANNEFIFIEDWRTK